MILLIDNYDSFTWNLVHRLGELDRTLEPGRDLVVVRNDKIDVDGVRALSDGSGPTHIIVSPGPCTPNEAGVSGEVISAFAGRVPILGVCLGHQCMAAEHGMAVERHPILMHGKTSPVTHDGQGVFAGLPDPFIATRYHSLIVRASSVPTEPDADGDGWAVSATSTEPDGEEIVMGLRRAWGEASWPDGTPKQPLEGVQFHPESFLTTDGPALLANFLAMGPAGRETQAPATA
ncbi:MAG: aminodeoxychorismate/anthranilate synthase component II [Planctomycetota bacterium]